MTAYDQEIVAIREWLSREDCLPQNFDDLVLRKFIHSCYGSLEKTKRCIEKFCIAKCSMPEIFTDRDPLSEKMLTAFSITTSVSITADNKELLFYEINDPDLEKFNFNEMVKSYTVLVEYWIMTSQLYPDEHIFLIDAKHYYLKILTMINMFLYKKFIAYLLECLPMRLKEIHVYNCPPYFESLYAFIKPIIPQKIRDNFHMHPTLDSLYEAIGKKNVPMELGGDGPSMEELKRKTMEDIQTSYRSTFKDNNFWKADLSRRTKPNASDKSMSGSFKTLDID